MGILSRFLPEIFAAIGFVASLLIQFILGC